MIDGTKMVKKVQEMRDDGYLSDAILREMVKQIRATDSDYNFVGVYLYNADEKELWLHNYMGESTEHAKIKLGEGVCGTAVAEMKNQTISPVAIQRITVIRVIAKWTPNRSKVASGFG